MIFRIFSLTLIGFVLFGCQTVERQKLTGAWKAPKTEKTPEARLLLRADNTFHVDLLEKEGIEVEGRYHLSGHEITFINETGTDAVSSDSTPGEYLFGVNADALRFEKVTDPLKRRAMMLSQTWLRENP